MSSYARIYYEGTKPIHEPVDLSSVESCTIHQKAIVLDMLMRVTTAMHLKITRLKSKQHLPGDSELTQSPACMLLISVGMQSAVMRQGMGRLLEWEAVTLHVYILCWCIFWSWVTSTITEYFVYRTERVSTVCLTK